ncbi:oxidoreductase [Jeongeupia naejangsanensis]|uniref:Oxidoreductase n=1 Tax=Jeongeupia naejangsanensis TaxID=613195 RepID=A0ABS2BJU4_9NEIS|nr:oxidoreductase [Jeongeupia naejangsanensis]MBM3115869.1 oxidoreductase [Jeongeupia naejangsanensis]
MKKQLQVGLIGYGNAGKTYHAPLITATPGLKLAAIASSRTLAVNADWPDVDVEPDADALIARRDLDLVVIATPNDSHASLARAALIAGRNVVVDKPFTLTVAEAESLVALATQTGLLLSVFHNSRWHADFIAIRSAITAGRIGTVKQFESRVDRFRPVVQQRWREAAQAGAGLWYDFGPHLVDQALQLFGVPQTVWADLALRRDGALSDDDVHVVLGYPALRVVLGVSNLVVGGGHRFLVHGTGGSLVVDGADSQAEQLKAGMRPGHPAWAFDARQMALYTEAGGETRKQHIDLPRGEYTAYYAGIRDALLGSGPNPVMPSDAVAVMRVIEAGITSSRSGRRIDL